MFLGFACEVTGHTTQTDSRDTSTISSCHNSAKESRMSLLDEFANDWRLRNHSPLTLDGYLLTLRRVEASHQLPIDLSTAKAWLADRQQEVSTATVQTYIRALKAFSRWFADHYDDVDSLAKLRYPKLDVPPPGKIADANEVEILRSAWKGSDFTSRRNRTMLARDCQEVCVSGVI